MDRWQHFYTSEQNTVWFFLCLDRVFTIVFTILIWSFESSTQNHQIHLSIYFHPKEAKKRCCWCCCRGRQNHNKAKLTAYDMFTWRPVLCIPPFLYSFSISFLQLSLGKWINDAERMMQEKKWKEENRGGKTSRKEQQQNSNKEVKSCVKMCVFRW